MIEWISRIAGWASSNLELGRIQLTASGWNFGFYKIDKTWGELKVFVPLSRGRPPRLSDGDLARYRFDVRLFNENRKPTDLYDFVVQFTTGPRHNLTVLLEDEIEGQDANPTMVQLPSCQWVDTSITRDITWTSSLDAADTVWLLARGPNDQHFRWLVARLRRLKAQRDP